MSDDPRNVVEITVTNRSRARTNLVLEPTGEIYDLEPGQTRFLVYTGDPAPRVAIEIGEGEIKVWAEGGGSLDLQ